MSTMLKWTHLFCDKMNLLKQLIFIWMLVLIWTIFVATIYGYCHGGLFYTCDKIEPPAPLTNTHNLCCPSFISLLNIYSFFLFGILYAMLTKFDKKILVSGIICLLQFPTILGFSLLLDFLLRFADLRVAEPFSLGLTYTIYSVWGFFFGVIIWEKLISKNVRTFSN